MAIDPNSPKTLYGGEYYNPYGPAANVTVTGVFRTDDGGETWRPANGGLPTSWITFDFLAVDPTNSATVYAATLYYSESVGGGVYKSTDGGGAWRRVSDERSITAIALNTQDTGIIYAGTATKGLLKTADGGASWILLDNVLRNKFITALTVDDATAALYAGTADGGVFRSTDEGNSWTQLNGGLTMPAVNSLAIDAQNSETVYAGTPGGIFKLVPLISAFKVDVPTGGADVASTAGSEGSVQSGYATAPIDSGSVPSGIAVLSFKQNGVVVSEVGVPVSPPTRSARIFVESRIGVAVPGQSAAGLIDVDTGLALAALGDSGLNVVLKAYQMDGNTPAGSAAAGIMLNQNGHSARFISELIPGLPPNFTGVMDISAEIPFAALTLRSLTNSRGDFLLTTFPVVDLNRPPSFPTVFPQIADGGGYVTQFMLFGAAGTSKATLQLWDNSGTPLAIGKP